MRSDTEHRRYVRGCEAWLETPPGQYAHARIVAAIRYLISGWPRRGQTLLHVGCGGGPFMEVFWDAGFDVTGVTHDPDLLEKVRQNMAGRADIQLAAPDHLPFPDASFDFVVIPLLSQRGRLLSDIMEEAFRVTCKGALVGFFNACSLRGLALSFSRQRLATLSPMRVYRDLHHACGHGARSALVLRSVLAGPVCTWNANSMLHGMNDAILPLPFGAYAAFRVDCGPKAGRTPLRVRASTFATDR